MAVYGVEIRPAALKDLRALDRPVQRRIATAIDALAREPRPQGAKKLVSADDLYRVRVGDLRIVYAIDDRVLTVLVVRIRHRREVYR
ncbi:MAG: type II toxin-antitoxin system RelE family toxin [Polyangiaceae bacterium]